MLNREKTILYLMERAGRPVSRLEMTKWCFLLRHEAPSRGGNAFYQFLPYLWGPFSFCLYKEADWLRNNGYIIETEMGGQKSWQLVDDVERPTGDLQTELRSDIVRIVERFSNKSIDALMDYVYQRFPWFTVKSNRQRLQERPKAPPGIYTAGYEGLHVDGFLNSLMRAGIARVVDVRRNAISRQYGFHRSTLQRLCACVDIEYAHLPQLGIPSESRRTLISRGDYESLFKRYEAEVLPRETGAMDKAETLVKGKPSALVCMEATPSRCHRSRLAASLSLRTGLPVYHIGNAS